MAETRKNPFTPTFGSIPLQLAGRDRLIGDILDGLDNTSGDPNRATIFVGARGSGKTVLLAKIAEEASANGWISVNVNADPGMLDELLVQARDCAGEFLSSESLSYVTSINIGGVGISRDVDRNAKKATWRSDMTSIVKELNGKGVGLLITVDELNAKNDELRTLIIAFKQLKLQGGQ